MTEKVKTGKELERRVADAYRKMGAWKVEHDIQLAGNQIDVYVELETPARLLHRIAVEAKDRTRPVGIKIVNEFAQIVNLLRGERLIDKGVIVSATGFSRPARNAAETYDIQLLEPADLDAMVAETKAASPEQVSVALKVLTRLMQAPEVQDAVITFRADFQAACEQIDVLGDYKDLHDLLHTLQFHCYDRIIQEAKRFLDDEMARDNLTDHELTLQNLVHRLRDVASQASFATNETSWIQNLDEASKELHRAIENSDMKQLKKATWLINRVLAVQPSQINTRLNAAARALRLPALVDAMMSVRDKLTHLDLDPEKIRQFEDGVNALASLNHSLTALINDHDKWQAVDLELRRIEANMGQDMVELELSWPDLKAMTEPLYSGSTDTWAKSLKADGKKLESAIIAQDPAKVKQYFRRYRRRASDRLYRVDMALKRLCEDLRKVGKPLASVLRIIE